ncbi:MAG: acetyltransferase [Gammaproteobacteria bacterium]
MTDLLIVGAGGHGRVVADAAMESGRWSSLAFLDDSPQESVILGLPVIGGLESYFNSQDVATDFIIAIGNCRLRMQLIDHGIKAGLNLPALVHPAAWVSRHASIGAGSVILGQAVIQAGAVIGKGCIINTSATVDHDCRLGDGVHVCPGAHVAGDVMIGARAWIGIGSAVRDGLSIGADAIVGAGAAVAADVGDDTTVVGVPARPIKRGRAAES